MSTLDHFPMAKKAAKDAGLDLDAMHNTVQVTVERAAGQKCPRCWNYHTVIGNPLEVCDRCMLAINEGLSDLVASGRWTEADAEEWRGLVRAMLNRWKAKT